MPKEIPMELKAKALEMLKTTDLNTVSRELHIYRRTLRLWANESGIQIPEPPRHEYYYSSEFKKEVVDFYREHGIAATLEQYPMSRGALNQWIKDAEPILAKDMITAPVCSEKASVASSRWDWPNERERRVMIHRLAEAGGELPDIVQKCLEAEKKYGVDTKIYPDDTMFTYDDEWRVVPIIGEPAEKETVAAEDACPQGKWLKGMITYDVKLESGIEFQVKIKGSDIGQFEDWIKSVSGIQDYNILKATSIIRPSTSKKTKLSAARIAAGLTQQELADKTGVAISQVQRWEYGKNKPKVAALMRMSAILGVALEDLVEDE